MMSMQETVYSEFRKGNYDDLKSRPLRMGESTLCPQDSLAAAKRVELGSEFTLSSMVSSKASPQTLNDAMSENAPYPAPRG
jgi:hypothetical protein